jgi:hypothetical protein
LLVGARFLWRLWVVGELQDRFGRIDLLGPAVQDADQPLVDVRTLLE